MDAKDSENPQHTTPVSVKQSAIAELTRRGFEPEQIEAIRLYGDPWRYTRQHSQEAKYTPYD